VQAKKSTVEKKRMVNKSQGRQENYNFTRVTNPSSGNRRWTEGRGGAKRAGTCRDGWAKQKPKLFNQGRRGSGKNKSADLKKGELRGRERGGRNTGMRKSRD